ncbi:hypothetical protein BGAL_0483g00060 [Botrytis galanthina]|uniref:Uncharacterized protein n=1 Tax=Botrytis galanthina TaxID=278940 RepID=A0A4S8QKT1_9HELO|nr:hypothetical protein BGAL_0483g00060 [Botrytis galanthina]
MLILSEVPPCLDNIPNSSSSFPFNATPEKEELFNMQQLLTIFLKFPKLSSNLIRTKNFHGRDRPNRERPLPRRVIIPQDVSIRLASPTIIPSVKTKFAASRNTEMLAWEAFQEAVRVQARAVAAYQNAVSNFKLVWEEARNVSAIVKPATV